MYRISSVVLYKSYNEYTILKIIKIFGYTLFNKQHCYKLRQAKIDKKSSKNGKQYPEAKFLLFESYSHFSSRYHPKIIEYILKIRKI